MVKIEIELNWAKKFRELKSSCAYWSEVVDQFTKYCDEEEERIAKEYKEYMKNLKSYSELELVK